MSRTFKTRPLRVRMLDSKDHAVTLVETHDHTGGRECDLPERDIRRINEAETAEEKTKCYYSFEPNGTNICGCKMCTGKDEIHHENRKNRHNSKVELHEAVTHHVYDGEDLDED